METQEPLPPVKCGDIAYLKSGGPAMTVMDHDVEAQSVECRWFWRGRAHTGWFNTKELIVWEGEPLTRPLDPWNNEELRNRQIMDTIRERFNLEK